MSQQLSPRQFAAAIGVSESSVRRWADDGKIKMSRTAGGHRKITRNEALRFIRATAATVVRPEILDLAEQPQLLQRVEEGGGEDRLTNALERGDRDVVIGLITGMYVDGTPAAEICDDAVRPAMQRIGERWPEDKRSILLEHRATSLCIDALIELRARFASVSKTAVAIGGAPENDPYILPSLMAATVLADVGYQAVNLGANTPLDVIADSAEELGALFVWVAMTSPLKPSTGQSLARLATRLARRDIQVVLGGRSVKLFPNLQGSNIHRLDCMSQLAGFAAGILASSGRQPAVKVKGAAR